MKNAVLCAALLGLASCLGAASSDATQALRYGTPAARDKALDEVLAGHAPESGPALLFLLESAKGTDRIKVIRALGVVRDAKAVRPLTALLGDPDAQTRLEAVRALGAISDKSTGTALAGLLTDADAAVRAAAAGALSTCGGRDSVEPLGSALSDSDPQVRLAAVQSLGALGFGRALPMLRPLLKDGDHDLKRAAALAIGALKSVDVDACLDEGLASSDPFLRAYSAEALALRRRDRALEEDLIARLDDPVYAVRVRSAETLGLWKSSTAVPALLRTLSSQQPTLRLKAVEALGLIRDPASKAALEYVRDNDAEDLIKTAATEALKGVR